VRETDEKPGSANLPLLRGVLPIEPSQIPAEILAGLTLAALAVPEVMGYTRIAGMPVISGLYTILIPTLLFALFGASRHLVVGADSATAAILAAGLAGLAATASDEYVALAAVLALMAAGFLLLARLVRLGFMADFLSRTVLIGFLTGVGIQVALGQITGMLGLRNGGHGTIQQICADLMQIEQVNFHALAIALGAIVVTVAPRWVSKKVPGALLAVIGAIVLSWALDLERYVFVLGPVPGGLPRIGLPEASFSWQLVVTLAPTAFAMFVVILAQSAATARAYAARYNERFNENTDLVGLGIANIGAGLSGAFVVNGSPTKTQMVDRAGGRTQLSLLVTSIVVLLVLLFLTGPLAYLPEAVLAAVVFLIGIDLIDLKGMRNVFRQRRSEFWVALLTALTVIFVGVGQGILLAIVLSLIDHTRHGYRPRNVVLVPEASGVWRPRPVASGAQAQPGLVIYRFNHSMYYANSGQLAEEIMDLVERADPPLRWLCIEVSAVDDVDYSASEALRSLCSTLGSRNIRLVVAQVLDDADETSQSSFRRLVGDAAVYATLQDVMNEFSRRGQDPT